jgi:hypothetical protein
MGNWFSSNKSEESKVEGGIANKIANVVTIGAPVSLDEKELFWMLTIITCIKIFEFLYMIHRLIDKKAKKNLKERIMLETVNIRNNDK